MSKRKWAAIAFTVYAAAIVLSNWLISHVGIPAGPGTHLTAVGFGLLAPSGVWAAAVSFPARDVTQRLGGRWLGVVAILVGALLSLVTSDARIAVASGLTYLCSETVDFLVYTPMQKRWFTPAVVVSGIIAAIVDSVLFLHLAGIPATAVVVGGLILGKVWVQLVAGPAAYGLRHTKPLAEPC